MSEEPQLPELLSVQAQAMVEGAKRLGLTWTLRPGTVAQGDPASPLLVFDGDTVPVGVICLIGEAIPGDRVMCLQIPPGGNFIIGRLRGSPLVATLYTTPTLRGKVASSGDVALTTAAQVVTPVTTLTLTSPGEYLVTGIADFDQTVSGGNNLAGGALRLDGVDQEQMLFGVTAAGQRATVAQTWHGFLSAGSHTFSLSALKSLNIGTFFARATRTGFTYQIWQ